MITKGSELGVENFIMGMAHRGRLNTLTNIFKKRPKIFLQNLKEKNLTLKPHLMEMSNTTKALPQI
jgi:2-oxoglutarate dehydrogenase complex dehydrogenase (E1) component-like enzyme